MRHLLPALALLLTATMTEATPLKHPINPPGADIPGISQAVYVNGGKLMYLSGHVPFDSEGKMPPDFAGQLDQVLANMKATLEAAGTDFGALVRVTFFVKNYDVSQLTTLREVRDRWIDTTQPPASALIGVQELFIPDALVEVDAIAVLPD